LLGLAALFFLVRGLMLARRRSRLAVATRLGAAGLLGGVAAPVVLQQTCTAALTSTVLLASAVGGLVGMIVIGLLIGRRRRRTSDDRPPAPVAAPLPDRPSRDQNTVYRFLPGEDTCTACRNHAAHRTYRTAEAAASDRAHDGCHCEIVPEVAKDPFLMARFAGRDVVDDRDR
jgi:hypothetical protein